MSNIQKPYDSTLARMAGNIAAGYGQSPYRPKEIAQQSIEIAREILRRLIAEQSDTPDAP